MLHRYKITFFKFQIDYADWQQLAFKILTIVSRFRLYMTRSGRKLEFYIDSSKPLDVLNSQLYPFYLSDDLAPSEADAEIPKYHRMRMLPYLVTRPLLSLIEHLSARNKELTGLSFVMSKFNPWRDFPTLNMFMTVGGQVTKVKARSTFHIWQFLSFDLTHSIQSEITMVKPVLASDWHEIAFQDHGYLEVKTGGQGTKLAAVSYDFWRHSLIVGQSGSGKSYLIKLMIEEICRSRADEYHVVLLDPHASLDSQIKTGVPRCAFDFKNLGTDIFLNTGQPMLSAEMTLDLFSTVIDMHDNQAVARVLKYVLLGLYGAGAMTLANMRSLLTDSLARKHILEKVGDRNVLQFFETEYTQLATTQYDRAVLPILNIIGELDFISQIPQNKSLVDSINQTGLTVLSVGQTVLGKRITKLIGGALLQEIFALKQAGMTNKKIILFVDEVSVVQTPSLIHILSEARKFGLSVILAQQYLLQVQAELLASVFANTVNYYCFKISRDDAEILARNLNCEIDEHFLKNKNDPREIHELAINILTELNPRELVARLMVKDRYVKPFKARTPWM